MSVTGYTLETIRQAIVTALSGQAFTSSSVSLSLHESEQLGSGDGAVTTMHGAFEVKLQNARSVNAVSAGQYTPEYLTDSAWQVTVTYEAGLAEYERINSINLLSEVVDRVTDGLQNRQAQNYTVREWSASGPIQSGRQMVIDVMFRVTAPWRRVAS